MKRTDQRGEGRPDPQPDDRKMAAPKNILVVEDDRDIARLLTHFLEGEGFSTGCVGDGRVALTRIQSAIPDLIILDLMLPGMDGLEVCRRLRRDEKTLAIPIIMLTAKGEETDKVVGLEIGADDYLTKPFSPKELVARVKAIFRRLERNEPSLAVHRYGAIVLDSAKHEVTDAGHDVTLTAKEFALLEVFLSRTGRVLTREFLLSSVWGYDYVGTTRTVDVHIRHLREKIPSLTEAIVTVKSIGYKLREVL